MDYVQKDDEFDSEPEEEDNTLTQQVEEYKEAPKEPDEELASTESAVPRSAADTPTQQQEVDDEVASDPKEKDATSRQEPEEADYV
jgi:hypothetical protein